MYRDQKVGGVMGFFSDLFKMDPEVIFQMAQTAELFHGDYEKAARLYQKAANNGHLEAKYNLAHMYYSQRGVMVTDSDTCDSIGWGLMKEAAAGGFPQAVDFVQSIEKVRSESQRA